MKTNNEQESGTVNDNACQRESPEAVEPVRELGTSGLANAALNVIDAAGRVRRVQGRGMRLTESQLAQLYIAYQRLGALIRAAEERARAEWVS